jgi:CRP-like cAMP-binding protein
MCDLDLRVYILGRLPFFEPLAADEIHEINRHFTERGYSPDEVIYIEGDPANRLYVVADGNVKLMLHTKRGKDVLLDVLRIGDFFGSLAHSAGDVYAESAYAHTPVCALSTEGPAFRTILNDHPAVALRVMEIMAQRLNAANEKVRLLSTANVEQRLAHVLLTLADKLGESSDQGILIQMPLGRAELAEMTGTSPETASRILSQFQNDGRVRTGRRWTAITDPEALISLTQD